MDLWKTMFLVLALTCVSFAGISVTDYSVSKSFFKPGEPGVATVTISNPTGSESVSSLTMTLDSPPELAVSSPPKLADISAGGSTVVSIPFRVKSDARPGIYLLTVVFQGYVRDASTSLSRLTVNSISIPVTIVNEPEFSISTDKRLLSGVDDVVLTMTNNGGVANNVRIRVPGNISLYGTDQLYVGTVVDEKNISASLDSRNAADGPLDLVVMISYEDELGLTHDENTSLRMTVRNEKLDLTFTQQSEVITGQDATLTLQIRNNGAEPLEDVRLSFENSAMRLRNQNEIKFGDLQPGATATVSASLFAELAPGTNLVNSTITWIEKDIQREESRTVPITITSDADVGVFLEARPAPLTMGSEHTVSVLVSNLGSYPIENVDVALSSPAMRSLDIASTQYIGGLQSDDFSTVQFIMKVNATSEGDYPVRVAVHYRDQSGEWKDKVITETVSVYAVVAAPDNTLAILLGVGILAVVVWYFKFRKK